MDHLLIPRNSVRPRIEVPLRDGEPYHGPFETFLERNEWSAELIFSADLDPEQIDNAKRLLQEWLFFGLIQEVFGPMTAREDWIREGRGGNRVLSTKRLRELIERLHRRRLKAPANDQRPDHQIRKILTVSEDIINGLTLHHSPLAATTEILTFAVLNDTISKSLGTKGDAFRTAGGLHLDVSKPIQLRMLRDGWCPKDVYRLSRTHDLATQYLASNFDRPESHLVHDRCTNLQCGRSKVDEKYYVIQHDDMTCDGSCKFISVKQSDLANILCAGRGTFPLIAYRRSESVDMIELVPADSGAPFVAISHVWSHGLGNPHDNSMPLCQLRRIHQLVASIMGANDDSPPPLFWLDTICFPVHHEKAADQALILMRKSYSDAHAVLVLDRYLERIESKPLLSTECLVRILVTSWTRRLWTLQEGALAQILYFNFADRLLEVENTVFMHTAEMTMITCDGSLEYLSIGSAIAGLCESWKTWRSTAADTHQPRRLLNELAHGMRWRETSVAADEPLCLATLSGVDMEKIIAHTKQQDRMAAFWSALPALSLQAIFWSGSRLDQAGYRWAPSTMLNQPDTLYQDFGIKSAAELQETSSARVTDQGLHFACPGIFLNSWRAGIGKHVWIRDENRHLYILYRPDHSASVHWDVPSTADGEDDDVPKLVLMMKKPLKHAFHDHAPERSVTCVIASVVDVDEEDDVVFVRTVGLGYLMLATPRLARETMQEFIKEIEMHMGFPPSDDRSPQEAPDQTSESVFDTAADLERDHQSDEERQESDEAVDPVTVDADMIDLTQLRKGRLKARDEDGRLSLDLNGDHLMFDGIELEEDQNWCLD